MGLRYGYSGNNKIYLAYLVPMSLWAINYGSYLNAKAVENSCKTRIKMTAMSKSVLATGKFWNFVLLTSIMTFGGFSHWDSGVVILMVKYTQFRATYFDFTESVVA